MRIAKKRVLLIDGHEDVLISLERLLENEGYDTVTAWSAKDAFAALDAASFDLILVNEYLPDVDAEDVLRELTQRRIPTPCFVMQPSAPQIMECRKFRMLGAVDVVCKRANSNLLTSVNNFFELNTKRAKSKQATA